MQQIERRQHPSPRRPSKKNRSHSEIIKGSKNITVVRKHDVSEELGQQQNLKRSRPTDSAYYFSPSNR